MTAQVVSVWARNRWLEAVTNCLHATQDGQVCPLCFCHALDLARAEGHKEIGGKCDGR
jgi:hypothetical protein